MGGAAVGLDGAADDHEAEAGAAGAAGAGGIGAVEGLEEGGEVLLGDAGAAVADGDDDAVAGAAGAELDGSGGGVAHGVLEQVAQQANGEGAIHA